MDAYRNPRVIPHVTPRPSPAPSAGLDGGSPFRERFPLRRIMKGYCHVVLIDNGRRPAALLDVSYRGFKLWCPEPVLVGRNIELELPEVGRVPGLVRWALGGFVGGVFLAHLPRDSFRGLSWPQD